MRTIDAQPLRQPDRLQATLAGSLRPSASAGRLRRTLGTLSTGAGNSRVNLFRLGRCKISRNVFQPFFLLHFGLQHGIESGFADFGSGGKKAKYRLSVAVPALLANQAVQAFPAWVMATLAPNAAINSDLLCCALNFSYVGAIYAVSACSFFSVRPQAGYLGTLEEGKMKKFIVLSFVASLLSGCATFGQMEEGLNALMGHKDETAFNVLGYPSGKQEFGSDILYIWGRNASGNLALPQTTTTYGNVGTTPFYGTSTSIQNVPYSYNCTIKLMANYQGILSHWEYDGNLGGCTPYIQRLNKFRESPPEKPSPKQAPVPQEKTKENKKSLFKIDEQFLAPSGN